MKLLRLGLVASSVGLPFAFGAIRRDLNKRNVEIAQIDHDSRIDQRSQEILFKEAGSDFEDVFRCAGGTGKRLTFDADQVFVACCAPGQRLLGSPDTAFDCCAEGHDLVGSDHTGYKCCPVGYGGWPVCLSARNESDRGRWLQGTNRLRFWHHYRKMLRLQDGNRPYPLGYDSIQLHYSAADHSSQHRIGRFKISATKPALQAAP
ncbi:cysteine-rich secreted protein [Daldinia childiae]|uniref:cysteine-rich secreted protein n=1 Tax=Daldinia childiae TaxID=326645 RepID=UPI0014477CC1|nr:cysteine-rich secreted protein [Daldinia childiae]KAF3058238.1 cysteine-rich secreted protein [Daldinia childiae]